MPSGEIVSSHSLQKNNCFVCLCHCQMLAATKERARLELESAEPGMNPEESINGSSNNLVKAIGIIIIIIIIFVLIVW